MLANNLHCSRESKLYLQVSGEDKQVSTSDLFGPGKISGFVDALNSDVELLRKS
jgi:hypothetical protein